MGRGSLTLESLGRRLKLVEVVPGAWAVGRHDQGKRE